MSLLHEGIPKKPSLRASYYLRVGIAWGIIVLFLSGDQEFQPSWYVAAAMEALLIIGLWDMTAAVRCKLWYRGVEEDHIPDLATADLRADIAFGPTIGMALALLAKQVWYWIIS